MPAWGVRKVTWCVGRCGHPGRAPSGQFPFLSPIHRYTSQKSGECKNSMTKNGIILWLRQDLRLQDHPALHHACQQGAPVIPVFIWSPEEDGQWPMGSAQKVWLHHSLIQLQKALEKKGSRLIIRQGSSLPILKKLIQKTGADAVYYHRRYEPHAIELDQQVENGLKKDGIVVNSFNGSLLYEPWEVKTKSDTPYKVFTRFWEVCKMFPEPQPPLPSPQKIPAPNRWPDSLEIAELGLLPTVDWAGGIRKSWQPGENGAWKQLNRFLQNAVQAYDKERNFPAVEGTSRLSPHLHFGEISPRQIWHALRDYERSQSSKDVSTQVWSYLREVGWREFAYHLLYYFPHTPDKPLRPEFEEFPWKTDTKALRYWQKGLTGYPIVDAGMRELWETGWMHNRVRMITASFLVKDLMIPWQEGAVWFWDTLVDADLANNTLGWQWTAGCGADAAPFFRIFNPVLQSEKFDDNGEYIRRWIPEISKLPNKWIHKPWESPEAVLKEAGIVLGKDYPKPIVDHKMARQQALESFQSIKKKK